MRLPRFEYMSPSSIDESLSILEQSGNDAGILAGGTDLLVNMKFGTKQPKVVINVKSIPELNVISADENGLCIGAAVLLSELAESRLVNDAFPAFQRAVKEVASKHIRNMASIGGNVCLDTRCWYYNQTKLWRDAREPCYKLGGTVCFAIKDSPRCHAINNSDTAPVLIALDAEVEVVKKAGKRALPLKEFYRDDGASPNVLEPNEMVTVIKIPKSAANTTAVFIKECSRRGIDFANGSVAVSVTGSDSKCSVVKIVAGSLGSFPRLLEEASQNIVQEGLTKQSIEKAAKIARSEFGTMTNLFTSSGYKRNVGEVIVKRALDDIRRQMKEKGRAIP